MKGLASHTAFVFARGGSKGIPGKNVVPLAGKPLIAWSIETALACQTIEAVIVSTDDEEIADVARRFGAEVPFMRPAELAGDQAPEWLAWQHAIDWTERHRGPLRAFISLPVTSPFRSVQDVEACLALLDARPDTDIVITVREASRNPYFNMVRQGPEGTVRLVAEPEDKLARRQDAPTVFDVTTVAYVARPEFVMNAGGIFEGRVRSVTVPPERALDIDTPFDLLLAECIANHLTGGDQHHEDT